MKDTYFTMRCSTTEKAAWTQLAKENGMTLAEYIRFLLNYEKKKAEK